MTTVRNHIYFTIANTVIFLFMLILVSYLSDKVLNALGGSIIYVMFGALACTVASIYSSLKYEVSVLNIVIFSVLLLNYFNYQESNCRLSSQWFIFRYGAIQYFIIVVYYSIVMINTSNKHLNHSNPDISKLILNIRRTSVSSNLASLVYSVTVYIIFFVWNTKFHRQLLFGIRAIPFAYFFAIVGFALTLYSIAKIYSNQLAFIFIETNYYSKERNAFPFLKKTCIITMLVCFMAGLVMEMQRHNWLLYIESAATVYFGTFLIGIIYKYKIGASTIISTFDFSTLSEFDPLRYFIRMWVFNLIGTMSVLIIFVILMYYFGTES